MVRASATKILPSFQSMSAQHHFFNLYKMSLKFKGRKARELQLYTDQFSTYYPLLKFIHLLLKNFQYIAKL